MSADTSLMRAPPRTKPHGFRWINAVIATHACTLTRGVMRLSRRWVFEQQRMGNSWPSI